ncbi:hypothetical protein A11A3_00170 [Alcanivorax hongdengensis A-11-3]|uniref:START domain-containing protein n=2 Tax=Alcanivorax hongdengensis TaxID=519051 RepID=L0WI76_9GAMM|nr:hypothetical protein A11A3_00170 [Alcanivorax hongdengensis A-11-3]
MVMAGPLWAADWEVNHQGNSPAEVTTYVRDVADSPVKAFRGQVQVAASMTSVLAVITAVDTFPQWVFQSKDARRIAVQGQEKLYMQFNGIWPVSDRDVVLGNTLSQDDQGVITLHSVNLSGVADKRSGYVRIPKLDNRFVLKPVSDGQVQVTFETYVDPGGRVPAWLANLVSTRAPLETLEGLQAQLKKPRFTDVQRGDLPKLPGMDQLTL